MKIRIVIALLLLSAATVLAGTPAIRVTAAPAEFAAGQTTLVSITLSREIKSDGIDLPKIPEAVWHTDRVGVSKKFSFVNGRGSRSETYTLPLTVSAVGEVTIPPVTAHFADGTTGKSAPFKLRVLPAGETPQLPETQRPVGSIIRPKERSGFYVGEEIPVDLELVIPSRIKIVKIDFPHLECDGPVIMPDYQKNNTKHPHFMDPTETVRETPEGRWAVLKFSTRLRFMRPGEFTLKATENVSARELREDEFDDPFFAVRTQTAVRHMQIKYPEIELKILPTPPPPKGAHQLGIYPNAGIGAKFSAASARTGEPLELQILLPGMPPSAELAPPALEFPGFRVYPPEETMEDGTRCIRYVLIPLDPGEHKISALFAVFDTLTGQWKTADAERLVAVTSSSASRSAASAANGGDNADAPPKLERLPDSGKRMRISPVRRGLAIGSVIFGILALAALIVEAVWRIREYRRSAAEKRRRFVSELIRRAESGESVNRILRDGGTAVLARSFGLPENAAPDAVAEHIEDGELRKVLEELDRNTFAPEEERRECRMSPEAIRELVRLLKRTMLVFAVLSALFAASGADAAAPDPGNAVSCYNAGAEYLDRGELPKARLHMERAHRLAPRNRRIRKGLETVEIELGVPTSSRNVRDFFRPDEYLILAGLMLGGALVAFALRRVQKHAAVTAAIGTAAIGVAAALLAFTQCLEGAPYRPGRVIVTSPTLELSSLPAGVGGHTVGTLKGGTPAEVIEERGDFILIRGGGLDGWCRKNDAERVFPKR